MAAYRKLIHYGANGCPRYSKQKKSEVKERIHGTNIALIFDETEDNCERSILNILALPLGLFTVSQGREPYLLDTIQLEDGCNNTTVTRSVLNVMRDYDIPYDNLMFIITDNASYMKVVHRNLQAMIPGLIHVTCWPHILNLVGEAFSTVFPLITTLLKAAQNFFKHAHRRKRKWRKFLSQNDTTLTAKSPPMYSPTRWNSWFLTVKYWNLYLKHLAPFVETLMTTEMSSSSRVTALHDFLNANNVQSQLKFICENSESLMAKLRLLESRMCIPSECCVIIEDLLLFFSTKEDESRGLLQRRSFQDAATKLRKYFTDGGQPGMVYFSFVRSVDPFQVDMLTMSGQLCTNIGTLEAPIEMARNPLLREEWKIYLHAARNIVRVHIDDSETGLSHMEKKHLHLKRFWLAMKERIPNLFKLADTLLGATCTSADVERSFARMKCIL